MKKSNVLSTHLFHSMLAACICLAAAGCRKDGPDQPGGQDDGEPLTARILTLESVNTEGNREINTGFSYDDHGLLTLMTIAEKETAPDDPEMIYTDRKTEMVYEYAADSSSVTATASSFLNGRLYEMITTAYTLESGRAVSSLRTLTYGNGVSYPPAPGHYEYDELGRLTTFYEYLDEAGTGTPQFRSIREYEWATDSILTSVRYSRDDLLNSSRNTYEGQLMFSYSTDAAANDFTIDLYNYLMHTEVTERCPLPIFGMQSNRLPSRVKYAYSEYANDRKYKYYTDNAGYVTGFSMYDSDYGSSDGFSFVTTLTFEIPELD